MDARWLAAARMAEKETTILVCLRRANRITTAYAQN
jgi:hypothetical protein